jgi:hypothetical protein
MFLKAEAWSTSVFMTYREKWSNSWFISIKPLAITAWIGVEKIVVAGQCQREYIFAG